MTETLAVGSRARALDELHRRSELGLIRLSYLVSGAQDGMPLPAGLQPEVAEAVAAVINELGLAQQLLVDQTDPGRYGRPSVRFLDVRFTRLKVAAGAVVEAVRTDDLPALRRNVLTFQTLAGAMRPIQLDAQERAARSAFQ